ncbi:kinase-like domain-containing protein [Rhizophagus irregularis DAOM 181602=DAOM 197198]|nr:kinase-like domain-containing protein [Rhizophagus irregularis DAOM 181602=DAOM 197198]
MDFEEAFYWYQKAAENGSADAMNNLADSYDSGEGIEINLEKAFYWYQQAEESDKMSPIKEVKDCNECKQQHTEYQWCKQCNTERIQKDFSKWTRGFSEIHKAIWSDGPIYSWNSDEQQWNRQAEYEVILKILNNSPNLNNKFLDEWKYHYNCQKKSFSKFIQIFGITQDPNNLNYIIANEANLVQEQVNTSIIQSHSQAYYTSRKLSEILIQEDSQSFDDCKIED